MFTVGKRLCAIGSAITGFLLISIIIGLQIESGTAGEATGATATDSTRGKVTDVEGRARRLPRLTEDWVAAFVGSEVISGDKFRTLRESRAELTLKELNVIRMAPLTTIDIIKLYEETKQGRDETAIRVEKGDIWALVSKTKEESVFDLTTPVAGAAITGTKFRVSVAEDSSTVLKVYSGEVRITNSPDNKVLMPKELPQLRGGPKQVPNPKQIPGPRQVSFEEWHYIVKKMQEIRIGRDGSLLSSGRFSADDPDEQSQWVLWNKRRDKALSR